MKIIPVIDVLKGVAVHAVEGKRDQYRPLRSVLCATADPVAISSHLKSSFNFGEIYLADLDSIMGGGPNLGIIRRVKDVGFRLMVDAGLANFEELLGSGVDQIIIGTEVCPGLDFVKHSLAKYGNRIAVSLDSKGGRLLSPSEGISAMGAVSLAKRLHSMGVTNLIFLDLARVGTKAGLDFTLLRDLRSAFPGNFVVGGGIRDLADFHMLSEEGIDGALTATALYDGTLSFGAIRKYLA